MISSFFAEVEDIIHERLLTLIVIIFHIGKDTTTMFDPIHAPIVDLHSTAVFEEPFYITLLEKTAAGSVWSPGFSFWSIDKFTLNIL